MATLKGSAERWTAFLLPFRERIPFLSENVDIKALLLNKNMGFNPTTATNTSCGGSYFKPDSIYLSKTNIWKMKLLSLRMLRSLLLMLLMLTTGGQNTSTFHQECSPRTCQACYVHKKIEEMIKRVGFQRRRDSVRGQQSETQDRRETIIITGFAGWSSVCLPSDRRKYAALQLCTHWSYVRNADKLLAS